jgi:hypothetical protein
MNKRYQIVEGPDGIHWVSIEPLIEDMKEAMQLLVNINPLDFNEKDGKVLDFKIASLKAATEFMNSLLTEIRLEQLREEYKDQIQ